MASLPSVTGKVLGAWAAASGAAFATHYFAGLVILPELAWLAYRIRPWRRLLPAVAGFAMKQFGVARVRALEHALYPILGWAALAVGPVLVAHLSGVELALLMAGGVLYTVGIPVLVRGRPDPWPRTFGYHEVWHAFTVAAGACHFAAVGLLVR